MYWLEALDVELFRFFNLRLINPVFDVMMPFVSGNVFFFPALVLAGLLLIWKGGARAGVFLIMALLVLGIGDGLICRNLKHTFERPRPFVVLPDVHRPGQPTPAPAGTTEAKTAAAPAMGAPGPKGPTGSMPSSHAANWFAATMVALIYYRRSVWGMLPAALLVSFSRLYLGVHYPSDVLVGAILGAGYAAAIVWSLDALWRTAFRRWFPLWWRRLPSLWSPELQPESESDEDQFPLPPRRRGLAEPGFRAPHVTRDQHWLRLGYSVVVALFLVRLAYLASGTIQLSEDEAYQWLWSKHLALSYFSKPPMIAYVQFLGTSIWGDNAFGVRFFSPVIGAILSLAMLRFFAREVNARTGFFLLLILTAAPLVAVGSILMTVDPLSVLFWAAAMLAGWRAVRENARTQDWLWVGLWMGLGFLSKYTGLFQWLCWVVFFGLWKPARRQLRRPGPYLALLVNVLCALPVLLWNGQHGWATLGHVASDAKVGEASRILTPEFLGVEMGVLNPVFFVAMVWAAIAFWRRDRHDPRLVYFFSMGAPLFLAYLLHSLHGRVLANWIAPSVLPLFCVAVIYWDKRWRLGVTKIRGWLIAGLAVGFPLVLIGHNTDLIGKLTGHPLPLRLDPLHRARGWDDTAAAVEGARQALLTEGKPVFIITAHYGMAGQISFYLPEAAAAASGIPLVYCQVGERPENQFYYWPTYESRKGENAIFVQQLDRDHPAPLPPSARLLAEFESVTDLGVTNVLYHDRELLRPLQVFACRGLK